MIDGLSDQEVENLIQIAEAGVKQRKRHWYTLGIKVNHCYNLDEQLYAVRQLGLSKNQKALEYLKRLSERSTSERDWGPGQRASFDEHPHARGKLWGALTITTMIDDTSSMTYCNTEYNPNYDIAKRTLDDAMSCLEKSVKSTS